MTGPCGLRAADTTRVARGDEIPPPLADFHVVFSGLIAEARLNPDGELSLRVGDIATRLDRPMQERTYLGTGGRQGDKEIAGQPLPLNYGWNRNAQPTLVDKLLGIYQVHDGEVLSILAKDRGQPLSNLNTAADLATYEELAALRVEGEPDPQLLSGQFATCRAEGYFRLGGAASIVTCDLEGDGLDDDGVLWSGGGSWSGGVPWSGPGVTTHSRYAGGMLYRILTTRGFVPPSDIDLDRIRQFDYENPFELGLSLPSSGERLSVREACTRIADSVGAVILRTQGEQIICAPWSGRPTAAA